MSLNPSAKTLGFQRITSLSSATALTVPAGTRYAICTPETQAVRWRDDGTDPTASVGYPLAVGAELLYDASSLVALKFIEQTTSASLNVAYFGD